jgi:CDP-glycerol glycerophosphotransferase (TagB/SpsB family)
VLKDLIKLILFILIKLIVKKKNLLVFGDRAGRRFADNSRHLFLYISLKYKIFKCVWISKDKKIVDYLRSKDFSAYHYKSLQGIYYCLRAKYHIFNFVEDDINKIITTFSNAILVWHGVLPKKLGKIKVETSKINRFINKKISKFFIYPNESMSKNILDRFPKGKYKLILSNLPRNLIFEENMNNNLNYLRTKNEITFINSIKKNKKNIYGYFPTWRVDGLEIFRDVTNFDQLKKTDQILGKTNSLILIKRHMNSEKKDENILYNKKIENISKYLGGLKNFKFINYDFDLNSVLKICDVLISDYSGVVFDFLYLNKPIITYAPDYDEFKKKPGFSFDPIKNNFTYPAYNLKQVNKYILQYSIDRKKFIGQHQQQRDIVKEIIFPNKNNIDNILEAIKDSNKSLN